MSEIGVKKGKEIIMVVNFKDIYINSHIYLVFSLAILGQAIVKYDQFQKGSLKYHF